MHQLKNTVLAQYLDRARGECYDAALLFFSLHAGLGILKRSTNAKRAAPQIEVIPFEANETAGRAPAESSIAINGGSGVSLAAETRRAISRRYW